MQPKEHHRSKAQLRHVRIVGNIWKFRLGGQQYRARASLLTRTKTRNQYIASEQRGKNSGVLRFEPLIKAWIIWGTLALPTKSRVPRFSTRTGPLRQSQED